MAIDARSPVDPGGGLARDAGPTMTTNGRPGVDRASAADVMELVCDVSGTSMQIAVVLVLQGGKVDLDAIRRAFDDRIEADGAGEIVGGWPGRGP